MMSNIPETIDNSQTLETDKNTRVKNPRRVAAGKRMAERNRIALYEFNQKHKSNDNDSNVENNKKKNHFISDYNYLYVIGFFGIVGIGYLYFKQTNNKQTINNSQTNNKQQTINKQIKPINDNLLVINNSVNSNDNDKFVNNINKQKINKKLLKDW